MKTLKTTTRIFFLSCLLSLALGACLGVQDAWSFGYQHEAAEPNKEARESFKKAQKYLNDEHYKKAADQFEKVYKKYEASDYAGEALYWRAFSLYRIASKSALRSARRALELQKERYRNADTRDDAEALYYRVLGKLAALGDSDAAKLVAERADDEFETDEDSDTDYDLETKMSALHALMNMKSERAIPILKEILDDKDPRKAKLREQALFLLAQHGGEDAIGQLMLLAQEDPSRDVRKQAVFWLSQTPSEQSLQFLEQLLQSTDDQEMQEQAIFAISQHSSEHSRQILQEIITDSGASRKAREQAIFWLGQNGGPEQIEFLMDLFDRVEVKSLKESIIFAVSQNTPKKGADWLMKIVFDEDESTDIRKNALFWASQQGGLDPDDLLKLYNKIPDFEMREQVVFALSQRHEPRALDIMMDLARKEKNPELRKHLVFWIGQSNDPRVEDFLLDIIND